MTGARAADDADNVGWDGLARELDAWAAAGRAATLWWRDDDATAPGPALDRLLSLTAARGIVPAIAVIPADAAEALAPALAGRAVPVQHGWRHADHAPPGARKAELGDHRPAGLVTGELAAGTARMRDLFGPAFLPVLVPPWNRIGAGVAASLPGLGFTGLSTWKARRTVAPAAGLRRVNCHVDPVDWRGGRGFAGDAAVLAALVGHLAARRTGAADPAEPTGLLTHHRAFDAGCWNFAERLIDRLAAHPAARWAAPRAIFEGAG